MSRKSRPLAPGTANTLHVAPPPAVRTTVPPVPHAQHHQCGEQEDEDQPTPRSWLRRFVGGSHVVSVPAGVARGISRNRNLTFVSRNSIICTSSFVFLNRGIRHVGRSGVVRRAVR